MFEPRIRIIEKLEPPEPVVFEGHTWFPEDDIYQKQFYNDYPLRFRGRKVDFHNGRLFVRITLKRNGELRLMPGSFFTRTPELCPERTKNEGHVWNK